MNARCFYGSITTVNGFLKRFIVASIRSDHNTKVSETVPIERAFPRKISVETFFKHLQQLSNGYLLVNRVVLAKGFRLSSEKKSFDILGSKKAE